MITLPDKIRNDLSSSAYQLQYLLEIATDPPILIGTRKENLKVLQGYDEFTLGEGWWGEELLDPGYLHEWGGASDIINDYVTWDTFNIDRLINGTYCIHPYKTYSVELYIENLPEEYLWYQGFTSGASRCSIRFNSDDQGILLQPYNSGYLVEGHNSMEFIHSNSNYTHLIGNKVKFVNCPGAKLYSLSIKEKQFEEGITPIYDYKYYEDANMKISNLKEKIDLKTKKIQYSDFTFTLSNLEGVDGRLSDNLDTIYGADINLYAITQSCDLIEDKLPIARLKASRMDHDDTTVKISANDRNLEGFYINLPQTLLEKDVNTYEAYNLKPVPILYGHLENAPAAVYIDNYQKTNLLVDDAFFSEDKDIEGVNQYNIERQDGFNLPLSYSWKDEMIETNCVKIKLDDTITM